MDLPTLRVSAFHSPPLYMLTKDHNTTHIDGPFSFLWTIMNDILPNRLELVHGGLEFGLESKTNNWTGAVGKVARADADILLSPVVASLELEPFVGFSTAFAIEKFSIMSGPSDHYFLSGGSLLGQMGGQIQLLLVISWVLMTVLFYVFQIEDTVFEHRRERRSFMAVLFLFYGLLLERGLRTGAHLPGSRVLVGTWLLIALVFLTLLEGILFSQLIVNSVPEKIDSLQEILKRPNLKPVLARGLDLDKQYEHSTSASEMSIYEQMMRHGSLRELDEVFHSATLDEVHNGLSVILAQKMYIISSLYKLKCKRRKRSFYISHPVFSQPMVFVYRRGLDPETVEKLNMCAVLVGGMGLMQKAHYEMTQQVSSCFEGVYSKTTTTDLFKLQDFQAPFIILVVGNFIGLILLVLELVVPRKYFGILEELEER